MSGTTITLTPAAAPLSAGSGTHRARHTAYDVIERLLEWLGGNTERANSRGIRRAILDAYQEFATLHDWTYLETAGRILLHGALTDGTIAYVHTGGAFERLVTLTGSTWPSWAEQGNLRLGELLYQIDKQIDSTRITLTESANPGADVASGTAYTLAQDTYLMPADFLAGDRFQPENVWGGMIYVQPRDWLNETRHDSGNSGDPIRFCFMGDPRGSGALVLKINPSPDRDQTLDFVYRRRMRAITVWEATTGTAAISGSNTVVTLAGGGIFTAAMKGSLIRFSSGVKGPEGLDSPDAYVLERTITQVLTSTTAQMDEAADQTLSGAYRISDPIDVEDETMFTAFVFGARKHLAQARNRDDAEEQAKNWLFQLKIAQDADARFSGRQQASVGYARVHPLIRRGPDIP